MYDDVIYWWPLTLLVKSIMQNHARVKHKVFQITLILQYLKLGHLRPIQFQNYLQRIADIGDRIQSIPLAKKYEEREIAAAF